MPRPVASYLAALAHELAFDPLLRRRVLAEVRDHLAEALSAQTHGAEPTEAEEESAVARFGSPKALADQYRVLSVFLSLRRSGLIFVLAICGVFLAMKARIAWYALAHWDPSARLQTLNAIALPVDRYAFLLAAACAAAGWLYALMLPVPAIRQPGARAALRRCQFLLLAAAVSAAVAVGVEILLNLHRFLEAGAVAAAILPGLSVLVEVACVAAAAFSLRTTAQRLRLLSH
jgi:hypothetical protein